MVAGYKLKFSHFERLLREESHSLGRTNLVQGGGNLSQSNLVFMSYYPVLLQVLCKVDAKTGLSCKRFIGGNIYGERKGRGLGKTERSEPWEGKAEGPEWVGMSLTAV